MAYMSKVSERRQKIDDTKLFLKEHVSESDEDMILSLMSRYSLSRRTSREILIIAKGELVK